MAKLSILMSMVFVVAVFNIEIVQAKNAQLMFSTTEVDIAVDLNRDGKVEFAQWEYTEGEQYEGCAEINNNRTPTDKTTPLRPYRFWLNNDFDIVNYKGGWQATSSCDSYPDENGNQVCEIWDQKPSTTFNNTGDLFDSQIENLRDLEDVTPLAIKFNKQTAEGIKKGDLKLFIKAVGVGVNLFHSTWNDRGIERAHDYIYSKQIALAQINVANYQPGLQVIKNGESVNVSFRHISKYIDDNYVLKFLLEGVSASELACFENAESCYLSVYVTEKNNTNNVLSESKLYLDLHDIKDFYELASAGSAQQGSSSFEASYEGEAISTNNPSAPTHSEVNGLSLFTCIAKNEIINNTRAVLVHGWRMLDAEKIGFAETGFKRLYWSGYQGKFSAVTWPTGWFDKPAHIYNPLVIIPSYLVGNTQNYNNSESVARRVGPQLANWLLSKKATGQEIYVIAHSMGNVVVGEALRQATLPVMDGYAATNAATVAGGYDINVDDNDVRLPALESITSINPETAWRLLNEDSVPDDEYDMPPDIYRYNLEQDNLIKHGATSNIEMRNSAIDTNSYYTGIIANAGKIVNYINSGDAALSAWELNQLTKPDVQDGNIWRYVNENICWTGTGESVRGLIPTCGLLTPRVDTVTSHFFVFENGVNRELNWGSRPITTDTADIIAHLIPARTKALGQGGVTGNEISSNSQVLLGLTASNQDHSAVFHGYFGDSKPRNEYWDDVLSEVFSFEILSDDYSGLVK